MKISSHMNLIQLARYMGDASIDDAREMRSLLVHEFKGMDITSISSDVWNFLLRDVIAINRNRD